MHSRVDSRQHHRACPSSPWNRLLSAIGAPPLLGCSPSAPCASRPAGPPRTAARRSCGTRLSGGRAGKPREQPLQPASQGPARLRLCCGTTCNNPSPAHTPQLHTTCLRCGGWPACTRQAQCAPAPSSAGPPGRCGMEHGVGTGEQRAARGPWGCALQACNWQPGPLPLRDLPTQTQPPHPLTAAAAPPPAAAACGSGQRTGGCGPAGRRRCRRLLWLQSGSSGLEGRGCRCH